MHIENPIIAASTQEIPTKYEKHKPKERKSNSRN